MPQSIGAPEIPPAIREDHSHWVFKAVSAHGTRSVTYRLSHAGEVRFLKIVRNGWFPSAEAEAARTRWASAYVPVAGILDSGATDDSTWLLSSAIAGDDATSLRFRSDIPALVGRLGAALRQFHDIPAAACPFSFRLEDALAHANDRLRNGDVDPARDFHPEHASLTAAAAVQRLLATRPSSEDVVVCHGDYCVPNVIFGANGQAGFVDLGELGTADRWWDLAVATWSLEWNFGAGYEALFLESYGADLDEGRMQFYRLLYDVVS